MFFGDLTEGVFESRQNRFLARVTVEGKPVDCFVPNSGRLNELLLPSAHVYVKRVDGCEHRTSYDLALVDHGGVLVSVDSRIPNSVIEEAIQAGLMTEFNGYHVDRREPSCGDSRLDLHLTDGCGSALIEVKSCTLVTGGVALFPDALTKRCTRHLRTLTGTLISGRSAIVFLIQRDDAYLLSPNEATDPDFSNALREAQLKGVEAYAYDSKVTLEGITINKRVPVKI